MAVVPVAEVDVTVDLVRALLRAQHPDLAGLPLEVVANGWDNVVLRLGTDLAVRVPRRAAAARLVEHEQRWLPVLAPHLPVDVPVPVRNGRSSAAPEYPWAWSVVPWFDGVPVNELAPDERRPLAAPLAAFVAALHAPAPSDAPPNPVRGVPLGTRDEAVRGRVAAGAVPDGARLLALWTHLVGTPAWDGPPVWLHGDPHAANLLATVPSAPAAPAGLRAVVDFGDITAGDPATDLATAWLTFDAAGRAEFRAAVTAACGTDEATWTRARGWALSMATAMLAASDDAPHLRALGEHAVAQVLAG